MLNSSSSSPVPMPWCFHHGSAQGTCRRSDRRLCWADRLHPALSPLLVLLLAALLVHQMCSLPAASLLVRGWNAWDDQGTVKYKGNLGIERGWDLSDLH